VRSFKLSGNISPAVDGPHLSNDPFAGLASTSATLQLLHLGWSKLPGSFMEVIQQLVCLTSLLGYTAATAIGAASRGWPR
jgi:hypothetical protein